MREAEEFLNFFFFNIKRVLAKGKKIKYKVDE